MTVSHPSTQMMRQARQSRRSRIAWDRIAAVAFCAFFWIGLISAVTGIIIPTVAQALQALAGML